MNSLHRRRDDPDPFRQWVPADKHHPDHDHDRRRNRSATLPAHSYDPRSYPSLDTRYNDPRHPPRSHRQDPHYPPAPSYPYHHSSAHAPSTSKAYQHATRPSAQPSPSAHHHPQPASYHPSHPTHAYPVPGSSRRPHPDPPDPRPSRRPHQASYDHLSGGEELSRPAPRPSRAAQSSIQPSVSAPPNQPSWNPPHETSSSRRFKDSYRDRDRDQDRDRDRDRDRGGDRERDKPVAEPENKYKDRSKAERHRERERATDVRYQDSSKSRHHGRRKDSDTEGVPYSEQRNASKASLSGREGYSSTVREPASGHRRHRTEDGTASTSRRHHPETTQNPITSMPSHSTTALQPDVQQTGEPPPAPRVMPVYLPPKAKSQRSHREGRPSTGQGAQSGSDTERVTAKHRMERTPSGPAVQRSDPHTSASTRERGIHDLSMGQRDDVKRLEGKYGAHQDARQPLAPINVDIPLVTPGFNPSTLPANTRTPTVPQIVSIRAGQGPSDPHDAHFKSSAISHSDHPQEVDTHTPHPTSALIVKSTRLYSSETRPQSDRPPVGVDHSRTEPPEDDLPPGQRMSIHESSRALATPVTRPPLTRENTETGLEVPASYPHSRPASRSTYRTSASAAIPSAVVGPRPLRSASQGAQMNETPARPPSQHVLAIPPVPNQHSVPSSSTHQVNGNSPKVGHRHSSSSSVQPSPKYVHLHGVSPSHSTSTQQAPSALPSVHPTPVIVPQTLASSSRPSRDGTHRDGTPTRQQSADQQATNDNNLDPRQPSNSTTVKASWVVQTPATTKRAKVSREDKYLRDHHLNLETPQAQLRQVLSQDDDPFPRSYSSIMRASQAATPSTLSQCNSPGTRARDVLSGTPRSTSTSNSPRCGSAKEAPTPEHVPRQNLLLHPAGPPQIAVVGATPVATARDLPQDRVDYALLAPPFPVPTRASRTTPGSQDQQSQPSQSSVRSTSSTFYQPQLASAMHAPSLFQPYQPPSPPIPEDSGQFSPPPLPIPPPRGLEDSPPPPIERRTSEIIPARSQGDGDPKHYVPEVQSEMFHLPQPSTPSRLSPLPPSGVTQIWQPSTVDNDTVPTAISNESVAVAHGDAISSKPALAQPDDVRTVHQEIMKSVSVSVLPSQSSVPHTRPRPKVTIEDIPEDLPVLSKVAPMSVPTLTPSVAASRPAQSSQQTPVANANPMSKSTVVDQTGQKSSPQSRNKDTVLYRNTEPNSGAISAALPIPPPTPAAAPAPATAPTATRAPSFAPPTQPAFSLSSQAAPTQRTAPHTAYSRTYQRASEMLQSSKLSTTPAGVNAGTSGGVNKSTAATTQTTYNSVGATIGQPQQTSIHGPPALKLVNTPTTIAGAYPSASAAASTTRVATPGLQTFVPSTSISTQPSSGPDPIKHQPGRPGPLSIPPPDTIPTSVMSTATVKNAHQEQSVIDSNRSRDVTASATRNLPSSSHVYPTSSRPGTSSATTQQTHVAPAQSSTHYRAVSLPITTPSSSAVQKPPSPRKYSQPISSTTVSMQPFPTRPSAAESQSARAPVSGHLSTPAPVRSARQSPPDHMNDSDMLKTPSSIAPSPMLNPDTPNALPRSMAVPIRTRQASTDSRDDKKKGLFGLFRTRTLSSKATDPPPVSSVTRASFDQGRVHPDGSAVASITPAPRVATSTPAPKELHAVVSTSTRTAPQPKSKGRAFDPMTLPIAMQTARDKDPTPHIFTPFKFLTMHSKRNRTVSAASLDVCDGNTATNTVVGSPDHSTVGQAQPLPIIIPPDVRDPLVATSEWRDREEAERRERKTHRIRRPGVTFDVEEEPPSPAPGTANKRKKLIRRSSGRAPTPGPPRG